MKIDKSTIDRVLKMNDDQLWKTVQYVAKRSGKTELLEMERPSDMTKIRNALALLSENDIQKAINMMKDGKKNG